MLILSSLVSLAFASSAWALPSSLGVPAPAKKAPLARNAAPFAKKGTNSTSDRSSWGAYDLSTNYYDASAVPDTGVVREYVFNIENVTMAPDGVEKYMQAINGQVPGPTIIADWGDTVVVTVNNMLQNNGSGLHFHGIRQLGTTQMDGVPSITQCPIAPGESYTYTWKATQYGSSWYHSHFYVQAWDGVFGGIVINGPATADYDEDLGSLFLNDCFHDTADQVLLEAEAHGVPDLDNGLLNGTNRWTADDGTVVGSYLETVFEANTSYLLRVVNAAAETHFSFSIDGHELEVIATDFVPIVPYTTDSVLVGMGQRYDIIVKANADPGNYWMRAVMQEQCSAQADGDYAKVLGIVRYDSTSTDDPTSTGTDAAMSSEVGCIDEPYASLVPYLSVDASDTASSETEFSVQALKSQTTNTFEWQMAPTSFLVDWQNPTVQQCWEGSSNFSDAQAVQVYAEADQWVYWIITTSAGVPHPMHIHGHDFWVLAQGDEAYDEAEVSLTYKNTPRRDVVMLPASGYVVIGFYTDNPGAWLFHCHIAWHTSEGLAVQIVERQSEWIGSLDMDVLNSTCAAWKSYQTSAKLTQDDSGI